MVDTESKINTRENKGDNNSTDLTERISTRIVDFAL